MIINLSRNSNKGGNIMDHSIERLEAAIRGALVSRGKNKGRLLARAPAWGTDAWAAWQGLMLVVNPWKCSMLAGMLMDEEHAAIATAATAAADRLKAQGFNVRQLDRDAAILSALGVM